MDLKYGKGSMGMAHKWPGSNGNTEGKDKNQKHQKARQKIKSGKMKKKKMMHKNATKDLYYLKMYYKILCFS